MLKTNKEIIEEFEKYYAYACGVSGALRLKALSDFILTKRKEDIAEIQIMIEEMDTDFYRVSGTKKLISDLSAKLSLLDKEI